MSVRLLCEAIASGDAPNLDDFETRGPERVKRDDSFAESKFDGIIAEAMERFPLDEDERPKEKRSLDKILEENIDRHMADEDDAADFTASLDARQELARRYPDVEGGFAKVLQNICSWSPAIRENRMPRSMLSRLRI